MDQGLLAKKQQIKKRIEDVGRAMGIPEDNLLAAQIVQIAAMERLADELHALRTETLTGHRDGWRLAEAVRKGICYIAGLLKNEKD